MANNDWKSRLGMVYSTNPDFQFDTDEIEEMATLPPKQQKLRIRIEKNGRRGKVVTLITGFVGREDDLKELGKLIKTKLCTGGTVKDGEIMIQGDVKVKVLEILKANDYTDVR